MGVALQPTSSRTPPPARPRPSDVTLAIPGPLRGSLLHILGRDRQIDLRVIATKKLQAVEQVAGDVGESEVLSLR